MTPAIHTTGAANTMTNVQNGDVGTATVAGAAPP
jgi:hypothetical protein